MGDTFDKLKAGAKAVGEKVTHPNKDLGVEYEKEKYKEEVNDEFNRSTDVGSNDPMSPEKIASHEPTAVKRDKNQSSTGEPV
jgi:hypothetical protein